MLKLIDTILQRFQCCFKRKGTLSWFVIIVVGLVVRTNLRGVSSIMGCLHLNSCHYESMIYFFCSTAYKFVDIKHQWLCAVEQHISSSRATKTATHFSDCDYLVFADDIFEFDDIRMQLWRRHYPTETHVNWVTRSSASSAITASVDVISSGCTKSRNFRPSSSCTE